MKVLKVLSSITLSIAGLCDRFNFGGTSGFFRCHCLNKECNGIFALSVCGTMFV